MSEQTQAWHRALDLLNRAQHDPIMPLRERMIRDLAERVTRGLAGFPDGGVIASVVELQRVTVGWHEPTITHFGPVPVRPQAAERYQEFRVFVPQTGDHALDVWVTEQQIRDHVHAEKDEPREELRPSRRLITGLIEHIHANEHTEPLCGCKRCKAMIEEYSRGE